jgi:hypothetical protein
MKKILALLLACTLFVSSTMCVCAYDNTTAKKKGSKSVTTEDLQKEIDELIRQINALNDALRAGGGGDRGGANSSQEAAYAKNNVVNYGGFVIGQGGHVEINGGRSNVTFKISPANGSQVSAANSLASSVGGALISCINTSSPGVSFANAKVNFYLSGVNAGDNIAVYQQQGKNWVQLSTAEIRKDHVVVNMTKHGTLAFIKVPVLAAATY